MLCIYRYLVFNNQKHIILHRMKNVKIILEMNYYGWCDVDLSVQRQNKEMIYTVEVRIITITNEVLQNTLNMKTIVIAFFLIFKQWVGSCTRPFCSISKKQCGRNDQNLAGTLAVYSLWQHSCAHCALYLVFLYKKQTSISSTAEFCLFPKFKV